MNWPLVVDDDVRYAASLSDPISGPGSPAYKHGYEPVFSKLFGVRQIPHGSFEPPLSVTVRILYPYRIGDVWFNDGNFVSYVDWLGRGEATFTTNLDPMERRRSRSRNTIIDDHGRNHSSRSDLSFSASRGGPLPDVA
jgi:hypothetical protein